MTDKDILKYMIAEAAASDLDIILSVLLLLAQLKP